MQLFRPEALRGQDRLHGDVVLVPPVSWQVMGWFLLGTLIVTGLFLATARYARVTPVSGTIAGDRGVVRAIPVRAGIVAEILVREGQQVSAGTPLARILVATPDGQDSLEARRAEAIARREQILRSSEPEAARATAARIEALRAQIRGEESELEGLSDQIAEQRNLVGSAETELERARGVAARGFVSRRDVLQREEILATRRQALSRLEQETGSRTARIASLRAELARAESEFALERAELSGRRAALAGEAAAGENASSFLVTAAASGTVTGIVAHRGDAVSPDRPILTIVPAGTRLTARLNVPPSAAGFVEPGQTVRLAVDAFPYQTYGTVTGRVDFVSAATVPVPLPDGSGTTEAFLVQATLDRRSVEAFGREHPLRPGMTVDARIATRSRSLAEWLFEPLYAVARR